MFTEWPEKFNGVLKTISKTIDLIVMAVLFVLETKINFMFILAHLFWFCATSKTLDLPRHPELCKLSSRRKLKRYISDDDFELNASKGGFGECIIVYCLHLDRDLMQQITFT